MKKGFTLIELIIALAVIALVIFGLISAFRGFTYRSELNSQSQSIIETLRQASSRTLASESAQSFGVHFEINRYVLFYPGPNYNPSDPNNQIFNLTSGVSISNINLNPAGADILFARVTGAPSRTGTIEILHNISQETISIIIDQAGQVGIAPQDSLPPLNTRAVDSRHVHFIYNQNVQNAVTLTLVWPDYPADNQSISFQSYLNPAKDDFDWAGTVIVNNQPQVLRIHTHSLSGVAAQFSITRDQRYNNVAMQINLDGQNLINYSAIGATTQGSAPGVIAPEPQ